MGERHLKLEQSAPMAPLRGPKLSPEQAALIFPEQARPSVDWVRRNVRPRIKIGRMILFYQQDVEDFIEAHRETA